ncbi:MAG: autotransporter [Patulibacter sp.]|nr:autotransporter [Patulibacter sp.]
MESTTSPRRRALPRAAAALVVAALLVLSGPAGPSATSAKTLKATENASLRLQKKSGTMFRHRGKVTGTVSGPAYSRIRLKGLTLDGTVTVKSKHGKLHIRIKGKARSGGMKPFFEGTAKMSGGTGRYRKAKGNGRFTGVVNRSNWSASIRAVGSLTY